MWAELVAINSLYKMKPYKYQKIKIERAEIEIQKNSALSFESLLFLARYIAKQFIQWLKFSANKQPIFRHKNWQLEGKLTQILSVYSKVNISHYFPYCVSLKRAYFSIPVLELTGIVEELFFWNIDQFFLWIILPFKYFKYSCSKMEWATRPSDNQITILSRLMIGLSLSRIISDSFHTVSKTFKCISVGAFHNWIRMSEGHSGRILLNQVESFRMGSVCVTIYLVFQTL